MQGFFQAIAIASAVLLVLSGLWTAFRLHGQRPFSGLAVALGVLSPGVSLAMYWLLLDVNLKPGALWGLLAGGAVVGVLTGRAVPVYARGPLVLARASGWHLLPPSAAIAAMQITGVKGSFDAVVLALAGMYAATGFTFGACAALLVRRASVRRAPVSARASAPATLASGRLCTRCGAVPSDAARFCLKCGQELAEVPRANIR